MNDDVKPTSVRRVAGVFGALFAVVLSVMAIQMARGHDPALGTTPKPTRHATAPAPTTPVQPQDGADGEYYGEDQPQQYDAQASPDQYQDPQAQYQDPQVQTQPPPVQSTTS